MTIPLVVVGAGGFGRETLDVIDAINRDLTVPRFAILGVVDSGPNVDTLQQLARRGIRYLGSELEWFSYACEAQFIVSIGSPVTREKVALQFEQRGFEPATVIHPSATLGSQITIGPGSVVCAGAQLSTNVQIGRHVHVNPSVTIGHDAIIHDFVSFNPGSVVSGNVEVSRRVLIGASATVLQGLAIGEDSIVGAMACVVSNVPARATVKGVPAK